MSQRKDTALAVGSVWAGEPIGSVCDPMNRPPAVARRRPKSRIPALWVTKWLRGGRFELTTFGLCRLTQLSLRVGLYLHPGERDTRHPVSTPSSRIWRERIGCLEDSTGESIRTLYSKAGGDRDRDSPSRRRCARLRVARLNADA
jgi:hypothetical protein